VRLNDVRLGCVGFDGVVGRGMCRRSGRREHGPQFEDLGSNRDKGGSVTGAGAKFVVKCRLS
jgi:hypothetical protein